MKKLLSILFFLLLFYVLPLSAKPELLIHWQVIFLAGICTILFATQPRLSITEAREKKSSDGNTVWLILLVSGLGQIVSLIEWAYISKQSANVSLQMIGVSMLLAGTAFRLYAIRILGRFFTSTVQIKETHQIISSGPYKLLRHPSYTGAYIAMLGSAIFLQSVFGILIFGMGMLYVYHLRIRAEEKTLTDQFKEHYLEYSTRTYKMFPFIW